MKLNRLLSEGLDDELKSARVTWNLYIPHLTNPAGSRYTYWDMLLVPITYGSMETEFAEWIRQCKRQNISIDEVKRFIKSAFLKADVSINTIPSLMKAQVSFHDDDEFGYNDARVKIVVMSDPYMSGVVVSSDNGIKDSFDLSDDVHKFLNNRLKNIIDTLIKMFDMWLAKQ